MTAVFERARRVADAVLYEGYILYPYRASAAKNQVRWQFGVIAPRRFAEAEGSERWEQRTEVIAEVGPTARVDVRVRFLQVQARSAAGEAPWEEAVEHAVDLVGVDVAGGVSVEQAFAVPAATEHDGRFVRERWDVDGVVRVSVDDVPAPSPLARVRVQVQNVTAWGAEGGHREDAVRRSLVGVHVLLHLEDGSFVSSIDPSEHAREAVDGCTNDGAFPVLIGDEGDGSTVLSSPIILYDRPEVAAESPGDMCDATEIDEILALRVLTLTDEEKLEARATDPRAAAIVDRVDDFAPEIFERLHGAIRSLRPVEPEPLPWWEPAVDAAVDPWSDTVLVGGVELSKGSKVVLRPGARRADAQDLFLAGLTATVAGVFSDVDGDQHVAVTVDGDPAADLHQSHGRFLYFHPDEVEPLP